MSVEFGFYPYAALTIDPRTHQARPLTPYEIIGTDTDGRPFRVSGASNPDGYFLESLPVDGKGTIRLYGAPGFAETTYPKMFTDQHGVTDTLFLEPSGGSDDLHLEQRGNDFVDVQGNRIVFPGVDGFADLFLMSEGRMGELDGLTGLSQQLGFKVRRIWCMGDKNENQVFSLYPQNVSRYFDVVRNLVVYHNDRNTIPLLTGFVNAQVVMPNASNRQAFWKDLNQALLGSGKYLMSGGNEAFKNGFDPDVDISDPGNGVIWSRGSNKEDVFHINAPATELHATRISLPRELIDTTASPPYMRSQGAKMCWMTEGNPCKDTPEYTPQLAWQYGRGYSVDWALAVFHDRQSQRGQLMHDDTAKCAAEWVRGMTL